MKTTTTKIVAALVASLYITAGVQATEEKQTANEPYLDASAYVSQVDTRDLKVSDSWNYLYGSYNDACDVFAGYGFDIGEPLKIFMEPVNAIVTAVAKIADEINIFDPSNFSDGNNGNNGNHYGHENGNNGNHYGNDKNNN